MPKLSHAGSRPLPLFREWSKVAGRIRRAGRLALFLDFDGTLVGFRRDPAEARLEPSTRRLLEGLARNPQVRLVFISGRRREDLRRRVRVAGALYIGLHGLETRPGIHLSRRSRQAIERVRERIGADIRHLPGVWLQDKVASLGLNYRGAPAAAAAKARAAAKRALETEGAALRVLRGKKIWELLAAEIKGKGDAAARVIGALGDGALALYVGDDATDETAFAALDGAITVRVGCGKRTFARYCVRNPGGVRDFLARLSEVLASG